MEVDNADSNIVTQTKSAPKICKVRLLKYDNRVKFISHFALVVCISRKLYIVVCLSVSVESTEVYIISG